MVIRMIYALISNTLVVNVIVWDGDTKTWRPSAAQVAVPVTDDTGPASIGDLYQNGRFVPQGAAE